MYRVLLRRDINYNCEELSKEGKTKWTFLKLLGLEEASENSSRSLSLPKIWKPFLKPLVWPPLLVIDSLGIS
jgi:hypothetical protein